MLAIIAIRGEQRGFAIAGLVIGVVGILWGFLVAAVWFGFVSTVGLGLGTRVHSLIYAQIREATADFSEASGVIMRWSAAHDGHLPATDVGATALADAGSTANYTLLDNDAFELTLVVDEGSSDPWRFSARYESDGDRTWIQWATRNGHLNGTIED